MRRPAVALIIPLAAAGVLALTACGGSGDDQPPSGVSTSAAARQAAGTARGDTFGCPEKTGFTYTPTIENRLPTPITLYARSYICNDWDGQSTPGHAFTGQVIPAKSARSFTLQPAKWTTRTWEMDIYGFSDALLGSVRMTIPQAPAPGWEPSIQVAGSVGTYGRVPCKINRLAYTAANQTPTSEWPYIFTETALALVSDGGRITLVSHCAPEGA